MEKSVQQQVHLAVVISGDKAMPEYLKASGAVEKTNTQQVSEWTFEETVANGEGCSKAGTP